MVAVKGARMAAKKSFRILRKFARATRGLNKENPKPVGSLGDALCTRPKKVFEILRAFPRATRTVSNRKLLTFDPPPLQWVFSFNFEICVWRPNAAGAVE